MGPHPYLLALDMIGALAFFAGGQWLAARVARADAAKHAATTETREG